MLLRGNGPVLPMGAGVCPDCAEEYARPEMDHGTDSPPSPPGPGALPPEWAPPMWPWNCPGKTGSVETFQIRSPAVVSPKCWHQDLIPHSSARLGADGATYKAPSSSRDY